MAATDLVLVCEQRLWAIALASPGFTSVVRPSNQIRFDDVKKLWPKNLSVKQAADAPEVRLDVGSFSLSPLSKRTFCGLVAWHVVNFTWTIIGGNLKIIEVGQVRAEIEAFTNLAGQDLGIPATVAKVDPVTSAYEPAPANMSGIPNGPQGAQAKQIRSVWAITIKG